MSIQDNIVLNCQTSLGLGEFLSLLDFQELDISEGHFVEGF